MLLAALLACGLPLLLPAFASGPTLASPWQTFRGGPLVARIGPAGGLLPDPRAPYVALVHPTAVAARGPDIYVADSGAGRLYRVDLSTQSMSIVPGVSVQPGTRIRVGADYSLYVLDVGQGRIRRFRRDGTLVQTLADPLATASFSDFAVEEDGSRLYAYDALSERLVVFHPAGGAAVPIASADGTWQGAGGLAADRGAVWLSDPGCRCAQRIDFSGAVTARLGEGVIRLPGPLAVDRRGRVFALDAFDRSVKVLDPAGAVNALSAAELGVTSPEDLAIDDGFLYIADGSGGRLAVLRLAAPRGK